MPCLLRVNGWLECCHHCGSELTKVALAPIFSRRRDSNKLEEWLETPEWIQNRFAE